MNGKALMMADGTRSSVIVSGGYPGYSLLNHLMDVKSASAEVLNMFEDVFRFRSAEEHKRQGVETTIGDESESIVCRCGDCLSELLMVAAALHDWGKAVPSFQSYTGSGSKSVQTALFKNNNRLPQEMRKALQTFDLKFNPPSPEEKGYLHEQASADIMEFFFRVQSGKQSRRRNRWESLGQLVAMHHGRYHSRKPASGKIQAGSTALAAGGGYTHGDLWADVMNCVGICGQDITRATDTADELENRELVLLSGMLRLSDWIASHESTMASMLTNVSQRQAVRTTCTDQKQLFEQLNQPDINQQGTSVREAGIKQVISSLGLKSKRGRYTPMLADTYKDLKARFQDAFEFEPRQTQSRLDQHIREVLGEASATDVKTSGKGKLQPNIYILEANTGNGKTEMAWLLMAYHLRYSGHRGAYVGLPTQATANGLFERMHKLMQQKKNSFEDKNTGGALPRPHLIHGLASLYVEQNKDDKPYYALGDIGPDSNNSEELAPWFMEASVNKLFADFSVGTIDQGLAGVVYDKYFDLRLMALANKVIILDEVHAYDTYMSVLLVSFVKWMAALGSTVIILSATLPSQHNCDLVEAYREGMPQEANNEELTMDSEDGLTDSEHQEAWNRDERAYPRLTTINADSKIEEISLEKGAGEVAHTNHDAEDETGGKVKAKKFLMEIMQPDNNLTKQLREQREEDSKCMTDVYGLYDKIQSYVEDGQQVAVICNTVSAARWVYEQLDKSLDKQYERRLYTSRFRAVDRKQIEEDVLTLYGSPNNKIKNPTRTKERLRKGSLVVATQVIEQSLDIDFDIMISEYAPIDLLIQRAGRVWRHAHRTDRAISSEERRLLVLGPYIENDKNKDEDAAAWDFDCLSPSNTRVYNQFFLARTHAQLRNGQKIYVYESERPASLSTTAAFCDDLVQAVYDVEALMKDSNVWEQWEELFEDKLEKEQDTMKEYAETAAIPGPLIKSDDPTQNILRQAGLSEEQNIKAVTRRSYGGMNVLVLDRYALEEAFEIFTSYIGEAERDQWWAFKDEGNTYERSKAFAENLTNYYRKMHEILDTIEKDHGYTSGVYKDFVKADKERGKILLRHQAPISNVYGFGGYDDQGKAKPVEPLAEFQGRRLINNSYKSRKLGMFKDYGIVVLPWNYDLNKAEPIQLYKGTGSISVSNELGIVYDAKG